MKSLALAAALALSGTEEDPGDGGLPAPDGLNLLELLCHVLTAYPWIWRGWGFCP